MTIRFHNQTHGIQLTSTNQIRNRDTEEQKQSKTQDFDGIEIEKIRFFL